jgi:aryl-alcohol dehydrogenase-like predicted oxidoreductase
VEEAKITDTLADLGIGLVAYSPLGRGFLTGDIKCPNDFQAEDFRRHIPRFQGEQFFKNLELVNAVNTIAVDKGITSSQLAIAWVLAKGHVPIPGTKRVKYVEQNIAATDIVLSQQELDRLELVIPLGTPTGDRYDATTMATIDQ